VTFLSRRGFSSTSIFMELWVAWCNLLRKGPALRAGYLFQLKSWYFILEREILVN